MCLYAQINSSVLPICSTLTGKFLQGTVCATEGKTIHQHRVYSGRREYKIYSSLRSKIFESEDCNAHHRRRLMHNTHGLVYANSLTATAIIVACFCDFWQSETAQNKSVQLCPFVWVDKMVLSLCVLLECAQSTRHATVSAVVACTHAWVTQWCAAMQQCSCRACQIVILAAAAAKTRLVMSSNSITFACVLQEHCLPVFWSLDLRLSTARCKWNKPGAVC